MKLHRPKNMFIVEIEGMDASGKETFSKSIVEYINMFDFGEKKINAKVVSFPNYDSPIGCYIKDMLQKPAEERNAELLDRLFRMDRIVTMSNIIAEAECHPEVPTVIVLDRYHFSNLVYSDSDDYQSKKQFIEEVRDLPIANMIYHLLPVDDESKKIHLNQLLSKENKDANETEEYQELKMLSYAEKIEFSKHVYIDSCGLVIPPTQEIIPIGSNYNNTNYESEILQHISLWHNYWFKG